MQAANLLILNDGLASMRKEFVNGVGPIENTCMPLI